MIDSDFSGAEAVETSELPAPLLPPIAAGTSLTLRGHKRCCTCHVDVSRSKRTLDLQGRFHCIDCWNKRVKAGTAIDLVPAGSTGAPPAQRALMQAARQNAMVTAGQNAMVAAAPESQSPPPNSIVVYVNPAQGPAAERGKVAFFMGFYATAGIAAAVMVLVIGVVAFFAIQSAWQKHLMALRQETPIAQEMSASSSRGDALQTVHLDAGVDGESNLRIAAVNDTAEPLDKVIVEVVSGRARSIASVDLGAMDVGQLKTIFVPVPGLTKLVLAGQTVRLRAISDAPRSPGQKPMN